ncbi:hypothetical protein T265_12807, partial [Opisthorchis viverrini]
ALLRPRSLFRTRLTKRSFGLPVRHQGELRLVESLDLAAYHDPVFAERRSPLAHPKGVRISRILSHHTLYIRRAHGSPLFYHTKHRVVSFNRARENSIQVPLHRSQSGTATAEKPIPHKVDQKFGQLASPASRRASISRKYGPIMTQVRRTPVAIGASRRRQNLKNIAAPYTLYATRRNCASDLVLSVNTRRAPLVVAFCGNPSLRDSDRELS